MLNTIFEYPDGEEDEFYAPEFIRKPRSENVDEGNAAKFQCQIDAYPPPTVSWEKDGKILEDGGRFRVCFLNFSYPLVDDPILQFIQMLLRYTSTFLRHNWPKCIVLPQIREDGEMFIFEIPHTLATDAGRYVVIATNSLGTEKYSVSLMVKEIESTEVTDFRGLLKSRFEDELVCLWHLWHSGSCVFTQSVSPDATYFFSSCSRPKLQSMGSGENCEQVDFRNVLQPNTVTSWVLSLINLGTGTVSRPHFPYNFLLAGPKQK